MVVAAAVPWVPCCAMVAAAVTTTSAERVWSCMILILSMIGGRAVLIMAGASGMGVFSFLLDKNQLGDPGQFGTTS